MTPHTATPSLVDDDHRSQLLPELEALRVLGSGATSIVYLAREVALQRLVAIKILRPDVAFDSVARLRFEREAQSAARISHTNVPVIYRTGRFRDDLPYIVMEHIDGRTVRDMLASGKLFDATEARTVITSVAAALSAAHDRGIVHRDVQVGNVFIENRTNRVLLADFGIAALLDTGTSSAPRLTAAGARIGDLRYMSPEQVRGEPVTEQSDIYALGILAYEVLTGSGPYAASSNADLARAHLAAAARPLQQLRPDLDMTLAMLIERCLSKDPHQRPRAGDVIAALNAPVAETLTPLSQFMDELERRRVYRVFIAYTAFAVTILGVTQVVYDAFALSRLTYQLVVGATLAGLPIALVISWLYDVGRGGIRRARASSEPRRISLLKWIALAGIVVVAGIIGWLLLR